MKRFASILLFIAALAAPASAQNSVAERIRRIEQGLLTPVVIRGETRGMSLAERMTFHRVPGVSIAVINDGRIEWAKGYGVTEAGGTTPVDTSTLFQAASISKPVAAMAVLRLVEQGKLSLDSDVNTALRSWRVPENDFTRMQKVTLRRLLSHNAGTTVHGFRGYAQGESVPSVVQVLNGERPANSAAVRVDTLPGALWRYSGGGTTIVQLLMQDVTGRAFPELVRELVLRPAQMVHSGYEQPLPAPRAPFAATGHRAAGTAVAGKWHTYPEMFAAGLWTTPSDLARLALEVQRAARGESSRILSPAMTQQMLSVQAGSYGLGFGVEKGNGYTVFSHGGANEGFRAMFYAFADRGQGVFIMTNGDAGGQLATELARAVAREYGWPTLQPAERTVAPIEAAALRTYAGTYSGTMNGVTRTVTITVDGNHLRTAGAIGQYTLHHAGSDRFFPIDIPAEVRFERDATGTITHAVFAGPGTPLRLQRVPQ